jgi:hypothetical protein
MSGRSISRSSSGDGQDRGGAVRRDGVARPVVPRPEWRGLFREPDWPPDDEDGNG